MHSIQYKYYASLLSFYFKILYWKFIFYLSRQIKQDLNWKQMAKRNDSVYTTYHTLTLKILIAR